MPGIAIKPAVLSELQRQLNHELSAAYAYLALALWCEDQSLKGFARFFNKQSAEEREHARKFIDHLMDRGVVAELAPISAPRGKFQGLIDIARAAQSMEQANTAGVNAAYEATLR